MCFYEISGHSVVANGTPPELCFLDKEVNPTNVIKDVKSLKIH